MLAISKSLTYLSHVFASDCNLDALTLWNSNDSVQKALDLTIPAKIEENECNRSEFLDQTVD